MEGRLIVEHKDDFIEYLESRRKRKLKPDSARSYGSCLESVSKALNLTIGRSVLSDERDLESILSRLEEIDRPKKKTRTNWGSAVKAYFEFLNAGVDPTHLTRSRQQANSLRGATRRVTVNAYERDGRARLACIEKHGLDCSVCEMNFAVAYGEIGKDYIHVHHIKPLHTLGADYTVDPETDLIPVCPNCHAMLHRPRNVLSIEDLKALYRGQEGA